MCFEQGMVTVLGTYVLRYINDNLRCLLEVSDLLDAVVLHKMWSMSARTKTEHVASQ
jgi:hypothetical protein